MAEADATWQRHAARGAAHAAADLAVVLRFDAAGAVVLAASRPERSLAAPGRLPVEVARALAGLGPGRVLQVDDAKGNACAGAIERTFGRHVGAYAAIATTGIDGGVRGAVLVARAGARPWTPDELDALVDAGEAVETSARLRDALGTQQHLRERLETQHRLHGLVTARTALSALFEEVAGGLGRQCPPMSGAVQLVRTSGDATGRTGAAPGLTASWAAPLDLARDDRAPAVAARSGREVVRVGTAAGPDGATRTCWSVPVPGAGGAPAGAVSLVGTLGRAPTAGERELLRDAARLVSLALHGEQESRELASQATRDALTGLPNRAWLLDHLDGRLAARVRDAPVVVMFLDLDRFKAINDARGHEVGDLVLREVADRLTRVLRTADAVARLGGDEFIVVPSDIHTEAAARVLAARLSDAVAEPIGDPDGMVHLVGASIGITLITEPGVDAEEAVRQADGAMYEAKRARSAVSTYAPLVDHRRNDDLRLAEELRAAVQADELHLAFQPIVELASGRVASLEALVRWSRPGREAIGPDRFIPLAEEHGLMGPIGTWVLEHAVAAAATVRAASADPPTMSINLSARQLADPTLPATVARALRRAGVPGAAVAFEITETSILGEDSDVVDVLEELASFGAGVVLDDFGTGYSSLTHLRRLPISALKIDRSFVDGLGTDRNDTAIVEGIVGLGLGLGLDLTGEGVETAGQAARLTALGCQAAQGYHFSRPVPLAALPVAPGTWVMPTTGVGSAAAD